MGKPLTTDNGLPLVNGLKSTGLINLNLNWFTGKKSAKNRSKPPVYHETN
jgi:hypothetical protein